MKLLAHSIYVKYWLMDKSANEDFLDNRRYVIKEFQKLYRKRSKINGQGAEIN